MIWLSTLDQISLDQCMQILFNKLLNILRMSSLQSDKLPSMVLEWLLKTEDLLS
jgi:hypothetical protein